MKIATLNATPIAIQDPPLLNAAGLHAPFALRIIVELETDTHISGISEIPGNQDTLDAINRAKKYILGKDPFHLSNLKYTLQKNLEKEGLKEKRGDQPWDQRKIVHLFSALEVACLDIIGKDTSRSVSDILGGAMRERVPFSAYLFFKYRGAGGELGFQTDPEARGWAAARQEQALDPGEIVAQAIAMCREFGFKSLKLKAGILEPQMEVESVLALRKAFGPKVPIRIDPNGAWRMKTALHCAERLKGIIEYFEDPVRGQENMAKLKRMINIPLATNMCTTSFEDIPQSIRLDSEDIILADHHFWGGLNASLQLAKICEVFDRSISMHSNSHLGISLAAMVHLGATLPGMPYSLDTHYPWQNEEVILGGRINIEEGSVKVPRGPGLGVELDKEELHRLHQNYITCGLLERNDEVEMQKVNPDWKFKPVRY